PAPAGRKRVGLHYTAFREDRNCKETTSPRFSVKIRPIRRASDELGLVEIPDALFAKNLCYCEGQVNRACGGNPSRLMARTIPSLSRPSSRRSPDNVKAGDAQLEPVRAGAAPRVSGRVVGV
ncbi:MAG TPA: hypothetical protein VE778_03085, partial [Candidatus Bathyarchaeia archaeon]|nr:hypothetical protein [Candidatus Bathyarchaeia archaeon]